MFVFLILISEYRTSYGISNKKSIISRPGKIKSDKYHTLM